MLFLGFLMLLKVVKTFRPSFRLHHFGGLVYIHSGNVDFESELRARKKGKRERRRREKQEAMLLGGSLTPEEDFPKLSPRSAPMGIVQGIVGICLC